MHLECVDDVFLIITLLQFNSGLPQKNYILVITDCNENEEGVTFVQSILALHA